MSNSHQLPKKFKNTTTEQTGSPKEEGRVVIILRHNSFAFAFQSSLWEKYKLRKMCKVDDSKTKKPANRNEYWQPKETVAHTSTQDKHNLKY